MINDFRTRLLNRSASDMTGSEFSEYIPSNFEPVLTGHPLLTLRTILYPSNDATLSNILTNGYLRMIDVSVLSEYTKKYDSRITYNIYEKLIDSSLTELEHAINWSGIVTRVLQWAEEYRVFLHNAYFKKQPDLWKLFTTFSDELVRFSALILLVFGNYE